MSSSILAGDSATPAHTAGKGSPRTPAHHFPQLDALRGIAAFVVVLGHFANLWEPDKLTPRARFLTQHVLVALFNGPSSVLIFFLLSGFVLSLPFKRGNELPYGTFLLRRLARIYLPYLAGLALALAGDWCLHQPIAVSAWVSKTWTAPLTWGLILQHVLLIGSYDTAQVNTAFWSLAVEMRLSILFPLICIPLMRWRRSRALTVFAAFLVIEIAVAHFLPKRLSTVAFDNLSETTAGGVAFAAGILLARWMEAARAVWDRAGGVQRATFFAASFVALEWSGELSRTHLWFVAGWSKLAGGCGVLLVVLFARRASLMLNHPAPAWLGRISYSLYLVHATVLFTLVHLFFGRFTRIELLLPYLVGSLGLGTLAFFAIEKPSIKLSRSIGRPGRAFTNRTADLPT